MEDGELDFSNLPLSNCSMDSFFDGLLMDTQANCTHTHTCNNPTGPENTHTHTCFHVHTKILPEESDEKVSTDDTAESNKKRPLGNREAVRKYREKKKAKAASLEDEVMRLRAVNQQLMKRLQSQAALEGEVGRLKCLLVDLRGRIDGEIGSFPYQRNLVVNPCNGIQCDDEVYCQQGGGGGGSSGGVSGLGLSGCEFDQLQCIGGGVVNGSFDNGNGVSASNKRKGGNRASKGV